MLPLRLVSSSTANAGAMRRRASSLATGQMLNVPTSCWRRSDLQWNESSQISSRLVQAGKIRKLWRQAFPRAWDIGSVSACDGSRLDGPLPSSGKARSLLRDLPTCFEGQPRGELSRQLARLPMKPGSRPVIALSFLDVAQDLATATDPASPIRHWRIRYPSRLCERATRLGIARRSATVNKG